MQPKNAVYSCGIFKVAPAKLLAPGALGSGTGNTEVRLHHKKWYSLGSRVRPRASGKYHVS